MSHTVTIPKREKGKKPVMPNRSKFVKQGLKKVIESVDLSLIALDEKAMTAYKYLVAFEQAINSVEYAANKETAYLKVKEWRARDK